MQADSLRSIVIKAAGLGLTKSSQLSFPPIVTPFTKPRH
jgi:hypothetical protein